MSSARPPNIAAMPYFRKEGFHAKGREPAGEVHECSIRNVPSGHPRDALGPAPAALAMPSDLRYKVFDFVYQSTLPGVSSTPGAPPRLDHLNEREVTSAMTAEGFRYWLLRRGLRKSKSATRGYGTLPSSAVAGPSFRRADDKVREAVLAGRAAARRQR